LGWTRCFGRSGFTRPGQLYEPVDRVAALLSRGEGRADPGGRDHGGGVDVVVHCGWDRLCGHGVQHDPVVYLLFDVRISADWGFDVVGGRHQGEGFSAGGDGGRTTLNGEGLQHEDGHSHLLASTIPNLLTYDPAFAYEMAVIIQDGMRRMYQENEDLFYYLTLYNENYVMPPMPEGVEEGILRGLYRFKAGPARSKHKAHLLASGPMVRLAMRPRRFLRKVSCLRRYLECHQLQVIAQ
jgi:pyruvate dehydrogenase E1 component